MTIENLFKVGLIVVFTVAWLASVRWVWTHQLDPVATVQRLMQKPFKAPEWVATREPSKIYQNGNVVGEVTGPVVEQGSTIRFAQLANTAALNQAVVFQSTPNPSNIADRFRHRDEDRNAHLRIRSGLADVDGRA